MQAHAADKIILPSPRIEIFSIEDGGKAKYALQLVNQKNKRSKGMEIFDSRTEQVRTAIEFKEFLDWPIVKILN